MFAVKERHMIGSKPLDFRRFLVSGSFEKVEWIIALRQLIHGGSEKKCESGGRDRCQNYKLEVVKMAGVKNYLPQNIKSLRTAHVC